LRSLVKATGAVVQYWRAYRCRSRHFFHLAREETAALGVWRAALKRAALDAFEVGLTALGTDAGALKGCALAEVSLRRGLAPLLSEVQIKQEVS
jgi:hypothetical protein